MEFALVAVVFLTLVLGLVDLGRAVMLYNTVATAAEEGARFGSVLRDPTWGTGLFGNDGNRAGVYSGIAGYLQTTYEDTIVGQVARRCQALDPGKTTVDISVSGISGSPGRGDTLTVKVSQTFDPVAGRLLHVGSFSVSATASVYME